MSWRSRRIQLGNVTVYGDSNTGAQMAKSFVEHFAPALDIINTGFSTKFKELFSGEKKEELPSKDTFEEVK